MRASFADTTLLGGGLLVVMKMSAAEGEPPAVLGRIGRLRKEPTVGYSMDDPANHPLPLKEGEYIERASASVVEEEGQDAVG